MRAMIFAAGYGRRMKPYTDKKPKALIEVGCKPLLEWLLLKLKYYNITDIVINVHHFSEQIIDFIKKYDDDALNIAISDESEKLLDTGGGLKKALSFFHGDEPILLHNVDILSDLNFDEFKDAYLSSKNSALLAMKDRKTFRKFILNDNNLLSGWVNENTQEKIVVGGQKEDGRRYGFCGISIVSPDFVRLIASEGAFSLTTEFLKLAEIAKIGGYITNCEWIDVGKPYELESANHFVLNHFNKIFSDDIY